MQTFLTYVRESFEELRDNVTWTKRNELQQLVLIVLVFSVIFSIAIWGADKMLSQAVSFYFNLIG